MQVPTYKATAKRSTGVSGQQMSFKVPGGALSQGQIAQAQGLEKISQAAAQWGAVSYGMHRNQVVAQALEKADASINNIFTEAQRKDINAQRDQDQPIGFFNGRGKQLLQESVMGIKDPFMKADIRTKLNTRLGDARRKLQTWNNATLIDQEQAGVTARTEQNIKKIAAFIPSDWNGKIENLPAEAQNFFLETVQMQENAVKQNIINYEEFEKFTRSFPSRLSKLSVEKRLLASRNSDDTELILRDVADPSKYTQLSPEDRQNLEETADRQMNRQIKKENAEGIRQEKQDAKTLKVEQKNTSDALYKQIIQSKTDPNVEEPTIGQILEANVTQSQRETLLKALADEVPQEANSLYVAEYLQALNDIDNSNLYGTEVEKQLDAIEEELTIEFAKGLNSKLNTAALNTLRARIEAVRNEDGKSQDIRRMETFIKDASKKDAFGVVVNPTQLSRALFRAQELYLKSGDRIASQNQAIREMKGTDLETLFLPRHVFIPTVPSNIDNFKKNKDTYLGQLYTKINKIENPKHRDEALRDLQEIQEMLSMEQQ